MEAMGAADVDPTFLGHGPKIKHAYAKPRHKPAAPPPPPAESEEEYMRKVMARAKNNTPGPAAIALTKPTAIAPVADSKFDGELETAHDMIRNKIDTKFGSLRKAFRAIDEDGTGKVRPAGCRVQGAGCRVQGAGCRARSGLHRPCHPALHPAASDPTTLPAQTLASPQGFLACA